VEEGEPWSGWRLRTRTWMHSIAGRNITNNRLLVRYNRGE
jgi:hypothetical protein